MSTHKAETPFGIERNDFENQELLVVAIISFRCELVIELRFSLRMKITKLIAIVNHHLSLICSVFCTILPSNSSPLSLLLPGTDSDSG
jgi:hypothetical protein